MNDLEIEEEHGFAYYRVSTELQDIKTQRFSVSKFLAKNIHLIIDNEFVDNYISGALLEERKAFMDMISRLDGIDFIVVYAWDRISREEQFATNFIYELRGKNIKVYESSTGRDLDFSKLGDRLSTLIASVISSEERMKIKARQKAGIEAFREEHGYWGRKVFYGINPASNTNKPMNKESFLKNYEKYRVDFRLSKAAIARIFQMGSSTLYKRIHENQEEINLIEEKLSKNKENNV